jgi:hypothetical protein
MKKTPEFEDVIRIYTPAGERIVPLSEVQAVLRKAPTQAVFEGSRLPHFFTSPPAAGVELRSGEIIWSEG